MKKGNFFVAMRDPINNKVIAVREQGFIDGDFGAYVSKMDGALHVVHIETGTVMSHFPGKANPREAIRSVKFGMDARPERAQQLAERLQSQAHKDFVAHRATRG